MAFSLNSLGSSKANGLVSFATNAELSFARFRLLNFRSPPRGLIGPPDHLRFNRELPVQLRMWRRLSDSLNEHRTLERRSATHPPRTESSAPGRTPRETKTLQVYLLTVAKDGPKFNAAKKDPEYKDAAESVSLP
jgi:hypothetical protein